MSLRLALMIAYFLLMTSKRCIQLTFTSVGTQPFASKGIPWCKRNSIFPWCKRNTVSCLIEILLSLMYSRMVLMVVCWHCGMPFDANGCVPTQADVDWIKWMYFWVNEFAVSINSLLPKVLEAGHSHQRASKMADFN